MASTDDAGAPVVTPHVTMFIRGMADGSGGGPEKPSHDFFEATSAGAVVVEHGWAEVG